MTRYYTPRATEPIDFRFWRQVVKNGECWEWTGTKDWRGYGIIRPHGRRTNMVHAHRMAYLLTVGPIPKGMLVCHHCDNPPCVRPDHLFLGTQTDNMADMIRKGRANHSNPARGEAHGRAKLTEVQVREIRMKSANGILQNRLAVEYGVRTSAISEIVNNKLWRHIK